MALDISFSSLKEKVSRKLESLKCLSLYKGIVRLMVAPLFVCKEAEAGKECKEGFPEDEW